MEPHVKFTIVLFTCNKQVEEILIMYHSELFSDEYEISGAKVVCMDMSYAIKSKQELIDNFKQNLDQHPNIKVAVIGKYESDSKQFK